MIHCKTFSSPSFVPQLGVLIALITLPAIVGCGQADRPETFEPNLVQSMKYEITEEIPMAEATKDTTWVVAKMFGTPDEPKLPKAITDNEDYPELADLVSMDNLVRASGPEDAEGRGLFRKHCKLCHGVTGNGRGPGGLIPPYPRDYRMGVFKFKSTPRGSKPTKEDLTRVIRNGIAGTAMNKIKELNEEDIQALVDYVIYLSIRGQVERTLIQEGVMELDLESGDRITNAEFATRLLADAKLQETLKSVNEDTDGDELVDYETYVAMDKRVRDNPKLRETLVNASEKVDEMSEEEAEQNAKALEDFDTYESVKEDLVGDDELEPRLKAALEKTNGSDLTEFELYNEAWGYNEEFVSDIAIAWVEAADEVVDVPELPTDFPVANSRKEFVDLMKGDKATQLVASVQRGQELFVGKLAACSKCHGDKGLGNGQTTDYDEWVKDWTLRVGLKPDDRESLIPLLARGALPPVNAIPRNFQEGIFRGGADSGDLYRRITQGIDGTPMPAATFVDGQFEEQDIWHLINFIRSLQTTDPPEDDAADQEQTKAANETPAV